MTTQANTLERNESAPGTLIVDLDHTLVRTDMLFETFWAALSERWLNVVPILKSAINGRAALKKVLNDLGSVAPDTLPYNDTVLQQVRDWRGAGGRTALVSASDQQVVSSIADYLGLFDEAHGSDGQTNLKGANKSDFLEDRFGDGYTYVGDSRADLEIWRHAARAVTVDASPALRAQVDELDIETEHLTTRCGLVLPALKAIRPHQWLKNALVILPVLAAHQFDVVTIGQALIAFVAFSLTASSVYLLNDLLDLASDRAHPRKRERPFASGALPLSWGTILAPGLLATGLVISLALGPMFLAVMVGYFALTTAYSFNLKRRLIIDICALAVLYTTRIVAGGAATGIPLSVWLLAFSIFFFFALAALKRQAELVSGAALGEEKAHGRGYRVSDMPLVANMAVSSGYVSVLVMALYLNSDSVLELYRSQVPLWGICLILLYWLSRMVMITHRGNMHDDPVVFAARDRISIVSGALILLLAILGALI